jgi:hypothetical protein
MNQNEKRVGRTLGCMILLFHKSWYSMTHHKLPHRSVHCSNNCQKPRLRRTAMYIGKFGLEPSYFASSSSVKTICLPCTWLRNYKEDRVDRSYRQIRSNICPFSSVFPKPVASDEFGREEDKNDHVEEELCQPQTANLDLLVLVILFIRPDLLTASKFLFSFLLSSCFFAFALGLFFAPSFMPSK